MASISQFHHIPCKTVSLNRSICSKSLNLIVPIASIKKATTSRSLFLKSRTLARKERSGQAFMVRAEVVSEAEKSGECKDAESLKKQLVDEFHGTNMGMNATSETRAQIVELINQLEGDNPTPAPTDALPLLNGKWILVYTSFPGLFQLLSRGTLPMVKVEEISQTIDSEAFTVQNSIQFSGPLSTTSVSANAKFEVRSPKRVQIKFEEGIIGTPQIAESIVFPENLEILGQKIDLTPLQGIFTSVRDTASNIAKTISSQPAIKIPIPSTNVESWSVTTYIDEELRISRGDGGSAFVLIKEGSSLLTP